MNGQQKPPEHRLDGLDLARYFALVGMVIVNFDVVMVSGAHQSSVLAEVLQGKAAATFVVLAGVGLGLSAARSQWSRTLSLTLKRAMFLLVVGLLNALIFEADIIHYYAFYFLFGVFFLRASNAVLWFAIGGLVLGFVALTGLLNYETGWDWETYTYRGFWEPSGFVRNLFFNGWHPVVPWFAFLLFGIWLSRLDLAETGVQARLALVGLGVLAVVLIASPWLIATFAEDDPEAAYLFGTSPIPPMPLYLIAGAACACLVTGLCLIGARVFGKIGVLGLFVPAGRQTLTLYIAHIVVGMGTLEALQIIGGQTGRAALGAAMLFCILATLYAVLWMRFFKRGPVEALMRWVAG